MAREGGPEGAHVALWAEVEALLNRAEAALDARARERDRAILAVLVVAERLGLNVKQARGVVAASGVVGRVPSEPTISRQRTRLHALLRQLQPQPPAPERHADPAADLRRAVGVASYPAFCARLRREHGLLLDPVHLQRALHPHHVHPVSPGVASAVLRSLSRRDEGVRRGRARAQERGPRRGPRASSQPLTPAQAARRLAEALAYEKRLPGEPGALARRLWRLTTGLPAEIDLLADAMRAWIVRKTAQDPVSLGWDAAVMFAAAWTEVTRAVALASQRARSDTMEMPTPPWAALSAAQRRAVTALAALPGCAWTARDLAVLGAMPEATAPAQRPVASQGECGMPEPAPGPTHAATGTGRMPALPGLTPGTGWKPAVPGTGRGGTSALPGHAGGADQSHAEVLNLAALVAGRWLAPTPMEAPPPAYVCTPLARRDAAARPEFLPLALAGALAAWRDVIVPRLSAHCAASTQPYTTMSPIFEDLAGEAMVADCLGLAARALRAYGGAGTPDPMLSMAGEMIRWLWRATSDLPVHYAPMLTHIVRVADPLLARLLPGQPLLVHNATEWAGLAAEHALIVAERVFRVAVLGEMEESSHVLARLVGAFPELRGGLLPPLDDMLTCLGAERDCWLTAYYGAIRYGILLERGAVWRLLEAQPLPAARLEATARNLVVWRQRLLDLEQRESTDEQARGLSREDRWNYPALARWDRGRIAVDFVYWSSLALLAEAQSMRSIDPAASRALLQQARDAAAQATRLYRGRALQNGKWDRTVYAILQQGIIELEAGAPIVAATHMVAAATEAVRGTVEMKTPRLALDCQLGVADALRRVTPAVAEAAERQERMHLLMEQIDQFTEMCRGYPRADTVHWVRDFDVASSAARTRPLASRVQAWSVSFMRAVKDIALVQDPDARRRVHEALHRIAPDRPSASPPSSPPRRHGRRAAGIAPDGTGTPP